MKRRSKITRDLRSPKYRPRIIPNRKKMLNRLACRKTTETDNGKGETGN